MDKIRFAASDSYRAAVRKHSPDGAKDPLAERKQEALIEKRKISVKIIEQKIPLFYRHKIRAPKYEYF